jgi:hypothetical protein
LRRVRTSWFDRRAERGFRTYRTGLNDLVNERNVELMYLHGGWGRRGLVEVNVIISM